MADLNDPSRLFALKRPCSGCPYTVGEKAVRLGPGRRAEIAAGLHADDRPFRCHQVFDYDAEPDPGDFYSLCAGALTLQHRDGHLPIIARMGVLTGLFDSGQLDGSAVPFESIDDWAANAPNVGEEPCR